MITQFSPTANAPFQFQATLLGPTALVASFTGTTFNVSVPWNTTGQRWYVTITDQNGNLVLSRALTSGSLIGSPVNLVGGWFTGSTMVFIEATSQFEVTP
jgi:hypothetical protein